MQGKRVDVERHGILGLDEQEPDLEREIVPGVERKPHHRDVRVSSQ